MFQVGDRVRKRHFVGDSPAPYGAGGVIIEIIGKWITVRHDRGRLSRHAVAAVPPRYDYQSYELEHENPLLKFAAEF